MKPCDVYLRQDHVANASHRHQFGAGRSRRETDSDGPADGEGDSDNSLFITQKPAPETPRSRRRRLRDLSTSSSSPTHREEDEAGPSPSSSPGESRSIKRRRIRNLPKSRFSFATETQKPVPEVARSGRRRLHDLSTSSSRRRSRDLSKSSSASTNREEDEAGPSPSSSPGESRSIKRRRIRNLPKSRFSFATETQKPVPEVARSGRRRLHDLSTSASSSTLREQDEAGPSPPSSPGESRSVKTRRIRNLPKSSFSFVEETQKPVPEAARSRSRRPGNLSTSSSRRRSRDLSKSSSASTNREEDEAGPSPSSSPGESRSIKRRRIRNLPKSRFSFATETQKPVPEVARSGRRRPGNLSTSSSRRRSRDLSKSFSASTNREEDEKGPSLPFSPRESRSVKTRRIRNLPKYSFSFGGATFLSSWQNKTLHNYAMAGFFKCVRELRQGLRRGADLQAPLPTVDVDGENISPLSDDEDAWSESKDIKVVERTRFVTRLKAKSSQPWHMKGGSHVIQNRTPVRATTAFPLDNRNVDPPRRDLTEKETSDEHFPSILVPGKSQGTNTRQTRVSKMLFPRKREEELCDSDATYCEPSELQGGSPWERTEKDREASPNVTGSQADFFTTDYLSQAEGEPESQSLLRGLPECETDGDNERGRNVTGAKGDHERGDQSREEAENASSSDIPARQEERRIPRSKLSRKRRIKNKLAADDVGQEQDGNRELEVKAEMDSLFALTCNMENGGVEKKQKKRRIVEADKQLRPSVLQPLNDAAEEQRNEERLVTMKETLNKFSDPPLISKEQLEESGHRLENTGSLQATEDYESLQENGGEGREEPGGLPAARSVHSGAEETPGPTEGDRAEPPATQTCDELNGENQKENLSRGDIPARQEERSIPDSKLSKKKKKSKLEAGDVGQEQDGNWDSEVRAEKDSLFSLTCNVENGGGEKRKRKRVGDEQLQSNVLEPCNDGAETQRKKEKTLVNMEERGEEETLNMALDLPLISKEQLEETGHSLENTEKKKKKSKMIVGGDGDIEQLQSSAVSGPPIDDTETQREKKRRKKEKTLVNTEEQGEKEAAVNITSDLPELNTESPQERLEASCQKKRKKQKKKRWLSDPNDEAPAAVEDGVELNNVTVEESTELSVVRKKKKKTKKRRESISEGVDVSSTPDKHKKADDKEHSQETNEGPDDPDADSVTKKKKKKKKKSEMFSRDVSEDAVAQSAESRSVRKKEKRRTASFLAADAAEKEAQTHEEVEQSFSTFTKSVVSAVPDESAENVEESDDGARKKKRKRKKSEAQQDHEREFEEANKACRGALPAAADAGKKRKKKPEGNESESVSAAGHCRTDEAAAFKKKKKKKVAPHHATQGRTDDVSPPPSQTPVDPVVCGARDENKEHKRTKRQLHNPCEDFLTDF